MTYSELGVVSKSERHSNMCDTNDKKVKVHVSGYGNGNITLSGIPKSDEERVYGALDVGNYWLRNAGGQIVLHPAYEPLPRATDVEMLPFWRHPTSHEKANGYTLFEMEEIGFSSYSISIQHLCGYYYSEEAYKRYANILESYGFACMRSRRGDDGKYWEIWYLPMLLLAQGDLGETIESHKKAMRATPGFDPLNADVGKKLLKIALELISRNVQFGTLDVSVQRMCMPNPD